MSQDVLFVQRRHGDVVLGYEPAIEARARATDVSSSTEAAEKMNRTGRAATEAAAVLSALHRHPGSTARELSRATPDAGAAIGQSPTEWDYTCSRRLPGLEDAGMAEVVAPSFSERRPSRLIDPNVKPCAVTGQRSIRWWTKL